MLRKNMAWMLAIMMACTMMFGIAPAFASGEPEKPKELNIWLQQTFSEEFNEAIVKCFEEFGRQNGITVYAEPVEAAALRDTKIPAAVEAKDTPNAAFTGMPIMYTYAERGLLTPSQPAIDELAANGITFVDAVNTAGQYNGTWYGIPAQMQSWLFWNNMEYLERAGYNKTPDTMDEFIEMSRATTWPSEGIYGAGMAAGATCSDFHNWSQTVLWAYGGSLYENGKINVKSEGTKEALRKILQLFEDGSVAPDMIPGDDMANNVAYYTGASTFIYNIPSIAAQTMENNPHIWEHTGISAPPGGPNGRFALTEPGIFILFDRGESENYWINKCFAFVMGKDQFGKAVQAAAPVFSPPYANLLTDPDFADFVADPVVKAHLEALANGKMFFYPDTTLTPERAALVTNETYVNHFVTYVIVEGMSFDDALDRYEELLQRAIDAI